MENKFLRKTTVNRNFVFNFGFSFNFNPIFKYRKSE